MRYFAILLSLIAIVAHADDGVRRRGRSQRRRVVRDADAPEEAHDYSRFSDGPRRVPEPRGAALQRAQELGLGTRETASRLLSGRPDPRWVEAAGSEVELPLRWPVDEGRFGRGFGYVRIRRPDLRHNGVDIVAEEGRVIRAVADGIVAYSDNGVRGLGNCVMIVHANGWVSIYAHAYRTTVQAGWRVRKGERIAFVGNTGISRGPHLHFEIRERGHPRDPLEHFEGRPWIAAYRRFRERRRRGVEDELVAHTMTPLPADPGAPSSAPQRLTRSERPAQPATPDSTDMNDFLEEAQRYLAEGPNAEEQSALEGRTFRNLLWPVRGEGRLRAEGRGVNITAPGAPVRAVADGEVIFVGEGLRGVGIAIVIAHPNGWVSLYGGLTELHAEVGQSVRRGEWIAHLSEARDAHVHLQVRLAGETVEIEPILAQRPE